jgi:hypothetical protein
MAISAAMWARSEAGEGEPAGPSLGATLSGIGNLAVNQTFLNGIGEMLNAVQDPERYAQNWMGSLAQGLIPMDAFLREVATWIDPRIRDARGIYDSVRAGIPLWNQSLPVRHDAMGREITSAYGGLGTLLPAPVTKAGAAGPEDAETARLGVYPSATTRQVIVGKQRITLSPQQAEQEQQLVGEAQRQAAGRVMSSDGYWDAPDEDRAATLKSVMAAARRAAESRFRAGLAQGQVR